MCTDYNLCNLDSNCVVEYRFLYNCYVIHTVQRTGKNWPNFSCYTVQIESKFTFETKSMPVNNECTEHLLVWTLSEMWPIISLTLCLYEYCTFEASVLVWVVKIWSCLRHCFECTLTELAAIENVLYCSDSFLCIGIIESLWSCINTHKHTFV